MPDTNPSEFNVLKENYEALREKVHSKGRYTIADVVDLLCLSIDSEIRLHRRIECDLYGNGEPEKGLVYRVKSLERVANMLVKVGGFILITLGGWFLAKLLNLI